MTKTINTLTLLVYVVYAIAIYFFLILENYRVSSIILMFSMFGLNMSFTLFKHYLNLNKQKDEEMIKSLKKANCPDNSYCDLICSCKSVKQLK